MAVAIRNGMAKVYDKKVFPFFIRNTLGINRIIKKVMANDNPKANPMPESSPHPIADQSPAYASQPTATINATTSNIEIIDTRPTSSLPIFSITTLIRLLINASALTL